MGHFLNFFKPVESMSAEDVRAWLAERKEGDHVVLDVRQVAEYEKGHIPGAVFIPLSELETRAEELPKDVPVVAYCKVGGRSRSAAALLRTLGFSEVYNMSGGILAWNGLKADGPPEAGMAFLDPSLSVGELAQAAWRLECGSRRFYVELAGRIDGEDLQNLLRALATAEERHMNGLRVLSEELGLEPDTASACDIMEGGVAVEDGIKWSAGRAADDVVQFLMALETNALDLYLKILRQVEDPSARRVFEHLAEEERDHLNRLSELAETVG